MSVDEASDVFWKILPRSRIKQTTYADYLATIVKDFSGRVKEVSVLDVGCGDGSSFTTFDKRGWRWTGLDIEDSVEVLQRKRDDLNFVSYDGEHFPLDSDSFDVVFSKQVLGHASNPAQVIREVGRVVKSGGYFFGSFSQLEPYTSRLFYNLTGYGFVKIVEQAGMSVRSLSPGIDAATLLLRGMTSSAPFLNRFFSSGSPLYLLIDAMHPGDSEAEVFAFNVAMLRFAGHIMFLCRKT
jgi:SAM-dependent methyltransferase